MDNRQAQRAPNAPSHAEVNAPGPNSNISAPKGHPSIHHTHRDGLTRNADQPQPPSSSHGTTYAPTTAGPSLTAGAPLLSSSRSMEGGELTVKSNMLPIQPPPGALAQVSSGTSTAENVSSVQPQPAAITGYAQNLHQGNFHALLQERNNLIATVTEHTRRYSELFRVYDELQLAHLGLRGKYATLENHQANLHESWQKFFAANNAYNAQHEKDMETIKSLETSVDELRKRYDNLTVEWESYNTRIEKLHKEALQDRDRYKNALDDVRNPNGRFFRDLKTQVEKQHIQREQSLLDRAQSAEVRCLRLSEQLDQSRLQQVSYITHRASQSSSEQHVTYSPTSASMQHYPSTSPVEARFAPQQNMNGRAQGQAAPPNAPPRRASMAAPGAHPDPRNPSLVIRSNQPSTTGRPAPPQPASSQVLSSSLPQPRIEVLARSVSTPMQVAGGSISAIDHHIPTAHRPDNSSSYSPISQQHRPIGTGNRASLTPLQIVPSPDVPTIPIPYAPTVQANKGRSSISASPATHILPMRSPAKLSPAVTTTVIHPIELANSSRPASAMRESSVGHYSPITRPVPLPDVATATKSTPVAPSGSLQSPSVGVAQSSTTLKRPYNSISPQNASPQAGRDALQLQLEEVHSTKRQRTNDGTAAANITRPADSPVTMTPDTHAHTTLPTPIHSNQPSPSTLATWNLVEPPPNIANLTTAGDAPPTPPQETTSPNSHVRVDRSDDPSNLSRRMSHTSEKTVAVDELEAHETAVPLRRLPNPERPAGPVSQNSQNSRLPTNDTQDVSDGEVSPADEKDAALDWLGECMLDDRPSTGTNEDQLEDGEIFDEVMSNGQRTSGTSKKGLRETAGKGTPPKTSDDQHVQKPAESQPKTAGDPTSGSSEIHPEQSVHIKEDMDDDDADLDPQEEKVLTLLSEVFTAAPGENGTGSEEFTCRLCIVRRSEAAKLMPCNNANLPPVPTFQATSDIDTLLQHVEQEHPRVFQCAF